MFNEMEIFSSTNEKQISNLQSYLSGGYLGKQGIKTRIECLSVENTKPIFFICAKRKYYSAVVSAASMYFIDHLKDGEISDIFVNSNPNENEEKRTMNVTKIPFGCDPEDIFERAL